MTIPVTLDNTRSVDAATYEVAAGDSDEEEPAFEQTDAVPAGEVRVVAVPVVEDTQVTVVVYTTQGAEEFPTLVALALSRSTARLTTRCATRRRGSAASTAPP